MGSVMDWDRVNRQIRPATFIEMCWCMVGPSGRELCGAVYHHPQGFEVRVNYREADVVDSHIESSMDGARERAAAWKAAILEKGGFRELLPE